MPLKLHVIVASTRPGRVGIAVGRWFHALAQEKGPFDARLVDLAWPRRFFEPIAVLRQFVQ